MNRLSLAIFLLPALALGQYSYFANDNFSSQNGQTWQQNGSVAYASLNGLTTSDANGGSLIYKSNSPDGTNEFEVASTVQLGGDCSDSCGTFVNYHFADANALSGPATQGNFYSFELSVNSVSNGVGQASLVLYKRQGGIVSVLGEVGGIPVTTGTRMRSVIYRTGLYFAYVGERVYIYEVAASPLTTGSVGVGVRGLPTGSAISLAQLGAIDRIGPNGVIASTIQASARPNEVDLRWQGVTDNVNGTGLSGLNVLRDGAYLGSTQNNEFADPTVEAGKTYRYLIFPVDQHANWGPSTEFTVTVPAKTTSGQPFADPRRVGLRTTGSYWGSGSEQVDVLSNNLNYSIPLLSAALRGGKSVPVALSYNSQNWRKDPAGVWKIGADTGYGFGWRLPGRFAHAVLLGQLHAASLSVRRRDRRGVPSGREQKWLLVVERERLRLLQSRKQ